MKKKYLTFNAQQFLKDYNIDRTLQHPHCTANRINIHCPFCAGSKDYHLGIHVTNAYGNCWRCGPHSIIEIVHALLNIQWREAYKIVDEYKNIAGIKVAAKAKFINRQDTKIPQGLVELEDRHKKYIISRKFDPKILQDTWGIKSTGIVGAYCHRIFIPIMYRSEIVSYQCRTPFDNVELRYKTCEKKDEKIHHKHILYGMDNVPDDTIVVVEGVTDVWRLGPGAVSTFGLSYTKEQMYLISKYKNIFILFDNEPAAQEKAHKLANDVAYLNLTGKVSVVNAKISGDPGDLPQEKADVLMHKLFISCLNK